MLHYEEWCKEKQLKVITFAIRRTRDIFHLRLDRMPFFNEIIY